jgi:hypothetical protein
MYLNAKQCNPIHADRRCRVHFLRVGARQERRKFVNALRCVDRPESVLTWTRSEKVQTLLIALSTGSTPITLRSPGTPSRREIKPRRNRSGSRHPHTTTALGVASHGRHHVKPECPGFPDGRHVASLMNTAAWHLLRAAPHTSCIGVRPALRACVDAANQLLDAANEYAGLSVTHSTKDGGGALARRIVETCCVSVPICRPRTGSREVDEAHRKCSVVLIETAHL